mmetsp:Transcript_99237/g.248841  ORF Transcript_99237/g.248841 Transcript_99237/m.248841 type:complete len:96 (+) Transcript_99237:423-710(+)
MYRACHTRDPCCDDKHIPIGFLLQASSRCVARRLVDLRIVFACSASSCCDFLMSRSMVCRPTCGSACVFGFVQQFSMQRSTACRLEHHARVPGFV